MNTRWSPDLLGQASCGGVGGLRRGDWLGLESGEIKAKADHIAQSWQVRICALYGFDVFTPRVGVKKPSEEGVGAASALG